MDVMEWMGMDESMAEFALDVATPGEAEAAHTGLEPEGPARLHARGGDRS